MTGLLGSFALEGLTILGDKLVESSENIKTTDHSLEHKLSIDISQSIVLSSLFFGSVYLFSVSAIGMNKMFLKDQERSKNVPFFIMNGSIFVLSGIAMIVCGAKAYPLAMSSKK